MSVSGFESPETRQVAGPPLTVWTRPSSRLARSSGSESGFLLGTSARSGSRLVGPPSQKSVPIPSTRPPRIYYFDGGGRGGGGCISG